MMSDVPIVVLAIVGLGLAYMGYKTLNKVSNNEDDIRELMYHRHPDFSSRGGDSTGMPINAEGGLLHNPTLIGSGIRGWY